MAVRSGAFVERHLSGGVLALGWLRAGRVEEAAALAASTATALTSQMPTAVYAGEGYAGPAEVLVTLLPSRPALASAAREAVRALALFARTFPVARPRALAWAARLSLVQGARGRAEAQASAALKAAVALGTPCFHCHALRAAPAQPAARLLQQACLPGARRTNDKECAPVAAACLVPSSEHRGELTFSTG